MGQTNLYHSPWVAGTPLSQDGQEAALLGMDNAIARLQHLMVAHNGYLLNDQTSFTGLHYGWYINSSKQVKKVKTVTAGPGPYGQDSLNGVWPSPVQAIANEAGGTLTRVNGTPAVLQWGNPKMPALNALSLPLWANGANLQGFTTGGHCTRGYHVTVSPTNGASSMDVRIPYSASSMAPVVGVEPVNAAAYTLFGGGEWAVTTPFPGSTALMAAHIVWRSSAGPTANGTEVFEVHAYGYI